MAYGIRLNLEAVYWREAKMYFDAAKENVVEREHRDPVTAVDSSFSGYSTDDALAQACMVVICLAICVEAAVNYVWNEVANPKYPTNRARKKALKNNSISERAMPKSW